jgi:hypothetical protein
MSCLCGHLALVHERTSGSRSGDGACREDGCGCACFTAAPPAPVKSESSAGHDAEVGVMAILAQYIEPLDSDARDRVVNYAYTRWHSMPPETDGPRTHWFEDLPASGDLVHYGGRDEPVQVTVAVDGRRVEYRMSTLDAVVPERIDEVIA